MEDAHIEARLERGIKELENWYAKILLYIGRLSSSPVFVGDRYKTPKLSYSIVASYSHHYHFNLVCGFALSNTSSTHYHYPCSRNNAFLLFCYPNQAHRHFLILRRHFLSSCISSSRGLFRHYRDPLCAHWYSVNRALQWYGTYAKHDKIMVATTPPFVWERSESCRSAL
jgi:hypothetical protein